MSAHRGWLLLQFRIGSKLQDLARDTLLPRLINQVSVDATPDGADIVLGMFYVNAILATILFDSSATHSFMSARYANTNEIPLINMRKPMVVITPKGPVEANQMSHPVLEGKPNANYVRARIRTHIHSDYINEHHRTMLEY
jgi:hypothetical protein